MKIPRRFAHRQNVDGSWDSICRQCFRTISTQELEPSLTPAESTHTCKPGDLKPFTSDRPTDRPRI